MRLSSAHKKSFYRFLALYVFAALLTVGGFSYLYYTIKSEQLRDETYHRLRERAFMLSSAIVDAQMHSKPFAFPKSDDVAFFDKNGMLLAGVPMKMDRKKEFVVGEQAYYLDRSARGHLGVEYILVKDATFGKRLKALQKEAILLFVGSLLFLLGVGLYLGKLFLEPIKNSLEQLDRFVKDSAHELNTPVTTLLLAVEKIEQKGAMSHYIRSLKMAAAKISKIYGDLSFLAFEMTPHSRDVDVAQVVHKSLEFFQMLIEQKELDLEVSLKTCTVFADEHHIEMLVSNLIDNAIKYAPAHSLLRIRLTKCQLDVENSGSIEDTRVIFERYTRAEEVQGGFGLGLDIVNSVVKRYGYGIDVVAQEGRVRFSVKFEEA